MPEKRTLKRAQEDKKQGKSPSTQAGEFVREEMDHIRKGKHGARSAKQAIAIGLSKARRSGVAVKPPGEGKASAATRKKAEHDVKAGSKTGGKKTSHASASKESTAKRSKTTTRTLKKEGHSAASKSSLSKQAHSAASKRSSSERSAAAKKGAATKGAAGRSAAAKKAARTRASHAR